MLHCSEANLDRLMQEQIDQRRTLAAKLDTGGVAAQARALKLRDEADSMEAKLRCP